MAPRKASRTTRSVAIKSPASSSKVLEPPSFKTRQQKSKKTPGKGSARATRDSTQSELEAEAASDDDMLRRQDAMADEIKALRQMVLDITSSVNIIKSFVNNINNQTESTHDSIIRILEPVSLMAKYGEKMHRKMSKTFDAVEMLDAKFGEMHNTIDKISEVQDEIQENVDETRDMQIETRDTVNDIKSFGADEDTSLNIVAKLDEIDEAMSSRFEMDAKVNVVFNNKLNHLTVLSELQEFQEPRY